MWGARGAPALLALAAAAGVAAAVPLQGAPPAAPLRNDNITEEWDCVWTLTDTRGYTATWDLNPLKLVLREGERPSDYGYNFEYFPAPYRIL